MGVEKVTGAYDLFKKRWKRQLLLHGYLKDLGPQFNKAEGYFSNMQRSEAKLPTNLLFTICDELGILMSVLFPTDQGSFDDPVGILRSQREQPAVPAHPFLDELDPRIERLLEWEIERQKPAASERALLEALEEQRHTDRFATQDAAEQLALKLAASLEATRGPKPKRLVAELAATLALWATIQRMRGFRDLAVKAFSLAFPLAIHSRDAWALGICFQRASYVLGDLGRPDLGYEFLRHAIFHFSGEESPLNIWKCHMDCGALLGLAERIEDSNAAYQLALERLPGSEWRFRACSFQGLGINARKTGNLQEAREYLVAAAQECRSRDLFVGQINWSLAKLEAVLKNEKESLRLFQEAVALLGRFGSAGDVALAAVDYIEALLKAGKSDQVLSLATQVLQWLPGLRANPVLRRTFERLVDLARAARLEMSALQSTRKRIELAHKLDTANRPATDS